MNCVKRLWIRKVESHWSIEVNLSCVVLLL